MLAPARKLLLFGFVSILLGNFLAACSNPRAVASLPAAAPLPAAGVVPVSAQAGSMASLSSSPQTQNFVPAREEYAIAGVPEESDQKLSVETDAEDSDFIPLETFKSQIANGQADVIRGVYAAGIFALRVIQQPAGDPAYVSSMEGVTTQFSQAAQMNVIGLLAHNYASGRYFFELAPQSSVALLYGDGEIQEYVITSILRYQALQPENPYSSFIDLETGEMLTASQLFLKVYSGEPHLTLQTCIEQDGLDSWGRIFIIAEPLVTMPTTGA